MTALLLEATTGHTEASDVVARLRTSFDRGLPRPLEFRRQQLAGIGRFLKECEPEIETALHDDMRRPSFDVYPSEIALIASEVALAIRKLGSWTKPERVGTPLAGSPAGAGFTESLLASS